MSLTSELFVRLTATETGDNDLAAQRFMPELKKVMQFTDGTTAGKADLLWTDERTIAASGSEDLDLAGVLTDAFGATITAAEIVAIVIVADAANTNDVVVGNGTAPLLGGPFGSAGTNEISIKPGGVFVWGCSGAATGMTVTATTGDELGVANSSSGTGVTYKIAILARTA